MSLDIAFLQVVVQTAWCGKNNLWLHLAQLAVFVHRCAPSIAGHTSQSATHVFEHCGRLHRQFASGHHHHRLHLVALCIQQLGERQEIGQRFARPCRREHYQVVRVLQQLVAHCRLHGVEREMQFLGKRFNRHNSFSISMNSFSMLRFM